MSDRKIDSPVGPCPLIECAITVFVREHKTELCGGDQKGVPNLKVEVLGPDGPTVHDRKQTNQGGMAEFKGIKQPDRSYAAKVTLSEADRKKFMWHTSEEQYSQIPGGIDKFFLFEVERLVRPKIKLVRQPVQGNQQAEEVAIPGVAVKVGTHRFGQTKDSGLAELPGDQPGIPQGSYAVEFTFKDAEAESWDVVDNRPIEVCPKCEELKDGFVFHAKKFWVKFEVRDQFGDLVSDLDYVLAFPGGQTKKTGSLKAATVEDEGPKGLYTFAVKLIYAARWRDVELEVGKETELSAEVRGHEKGTDVTFEIYDARALSGSPLDTVRGKSSGDEAVKVAWKPEAAKLEKVMSGELVFLAKIGDRWAVSPPAPILGKQVFEVFDREGQPASAKLVLHFASGLRIEGQAAGGKFEPPVPLGQRLHHVELPDHRTARVGFKGQGDAQSSDFLQPKGA